MRKVLWLLLAGVAGLFGQGEDDRYRSPAISCSYMSRDNRAVCDYLKWILPREWDQSLHGQWSVSLVVPRKLDTLQLVITWTADGAKAEYRPFIDLAACQRKARQKSELNQQQKLARCISNNVLSLVDQHFLAVPKSSAMR